MKKLLFIAICFVSLNLSAQGNLQFNQVITYSEYDSGGGNFPAVTIGTVPTGKVWKIEYYMSSACGIGWNLNNAGNFCGTAAGPIWLKEGDILKGRAGNSLGGSRILSIIEFNVVP